MLGNESNRPWRIPGNDPLLLALTVLLGLTFLVLFAPSILFLDYLLFVTVILSTATTVFFFLKPEIALLIFFSLRAILDLLWWLPASLASMNPSEAFSGAVAGLAMVLFFLVFRRFDKHPCIIPFLVYLLFMGVSAVRATALRDSAEILARYLSTFFIMFVGSEFFSTRRTRYTVVVVACAVGVVPVGVSLYHLATGQMSEVSLAGLPRLIGGYKNLHNHALMVMYFSIMGVFWAFNTRARLQRVMAVAFAAGAILCMYLTYVRTAWIGFALFCAVFLWMEGHTRVLVAAAIAVVLFGATNSLVQQRFMDFLVVFNQSAGYDIDRLGSDRAGIWLTAIREYSYYTFGDKILGLGANQHTVLTAQFSHMYLSEAKDTHNDYLSMLFQMGPFALLAYLAMQVQVIRYALRLRALTTQVFWRSFASLVIGLDLCQFFANAISNAFIHRTTIGWYFWGLAGVLFAEVKALEMGAEPLDPVTRTVGAALKKVPRFRMAPPPGESA